MFGVVFLALMMAAGFCVLGWTLQFAFKLMFGLLGVFVGGLLFAVLGTVTLLVIGIVGFALMLPLAIPLLLIATLVWALSPRQRRRPLIIEG